MSLILYVSFVVTLMLVSLFIKDTEPPLHGVYTRVVYPAVSVLVSLFARVRTSASSVDFMVLYGNRTNKRQGVIETSVNISSLILFLSIPIAVNELSHPGGFENFICFALAGLGYFMPRLDLRQRASVERESILRDFPVFCMDLAVLAKAGLGLEKAWTRALSDRPGSSFYKEARLMVLRMETGVSLEQSIILFARRLGIPEIYSFASVVSQSVKSGESGTADIIKDFAVQSWNIRCMRAKEKGEKASVKMVFPLAMGLSGIILVVAFPAFAAMKGLI